MHILHITNNCNRGGANNVLLPIIKELSNINIKFTIAYIDGPELAKMEFNKIGATTCKLGKNPIMIFYRLKKILNAKKSPVLLIHTHLVHATLIGRLIGLLFNIPIITTRHFLERRKQNNIFHILEEYSYRFNSMTIAISNAVKDHLINSKIVNTNQCHRIYNPIDSSFFNQNLKFKKNNYKIVCIGRLSIIKGIKYLIHAFTKVPELICNAKLLIIGRNDGAEDEIKYLINNHKYKQNIHLIGFLNRKKILNELKTTNIYIQPSISEGLGISALEAMAMGIPCILSDVGGLREIGDNNKNAILVPPRNSESIYEAIVDLYKNPNKAKRISNNGMKFTSKEINPKQIASQHLELYNKIIN